MDLEEELKARFQRDGRRRRKSPPSATPSAERSSSKPAKCFMRLDEKDVSYLLDIAVCVDDILAYTSPIS